MDIDIEDAQALMGALKHQRQMNSISKQLSAKKASQAPSYPTPAELDSHEQETRNMNDIIEPDGVRNAGYHEWFDQCAFQDDQGRLVSSHPSPPLSNEFVVNPPE